MNDECTDLTMVEDEASMDRISELPEPILHRILYFLPTKDAARAGVLSKKWNSVCFSSPILDFDDTLISRRKFENFVKESISRFENDLKGIAIYKFRLNMLFVVKSDSFVKNLLGFAVDRNVKELTLCLRRQTPITLVVPQSIFDSKSITVLKLRDCSLESSVSISLRSLKTLSIVNCYLDDVVFSKIISGCPLIEDLSIMWCIGLKTVKFSSLDLKFMRLGYSLYLEIVVVEAPNLQSFEFVSFSSVCELNIAACVELRKLRLERVDFMADNMLEDMISQFVSLEDLIVKECRLLENVIISSWNLRKLVLSDCKKLVDLKISTPKLVSFTYSGNLISFDSTNSLNLSETKICFNHESAESYCYTKLRNFLEKLNHCKVLNLGCNYDKGLIIPNEIRDDGIRPPSYVEHLKVDIPSDCSGVSKLKDGLLCLFPNLKTLSVVYRFPNRCHKFQNENLWTTESCRSHSKSITLQWRCLKSLSLRALKQRFMKCIKC